MLVLFPTNLFYLANENFKKGDFGNYGHVLLDNVVVATNVDELSTPIEPDSNFITNWIFLPVSVSKPRAMAHTTRIQYLIIFSLMMSIRRSFHVYVPILEGLQANPM